MVWKCAEKWVFKKHFHEDMAAGSYIWHRVVHCCTGGVLGAGPLLVRATPSLASSSFSRQGWILGCCRSSFSFHARAGGVSALVGGTCGGGCGLLAAESFSSL